MAILVAVDPRTNPAKATIKKALRVDFDIKAPEDLAGPISQTFFLWLNSLFLTGYKRAFTTTDLGMISSPLYAKSILAKFSNIANGHIASSGNGFALQTFTSLGFYALAPVIPRLAVTGFTFSQSFLVTALLKYLEHGEQRPASHGYGLLGACAFVYIGIAVSNSWYWRHMYKSVSIIRGGLVVSIFEKVLRLPEDGGTEAKATTLMISDVQRIVSGLAFIHEVWAGILETALATYLLQRIMGVSSMAMLGLALACGAISSFVASKISVQQRNWLKAMEQRIDATKRLLDSLKAVKMRGAEDRVGQVVNELRRLEIQAARLFRALITVSVFLSYSTVTLSPLLVFAAYIGVNGADSDLDSATMFSSLVLIALLGSPLIHLFQAMPALGSAQGCFGRIHAFLETPEMFQNASVDLQRTRMHRGDTRLSSNPSGSYQPAISIRNASLGWSSDETVLENINLEVARGSFVALVGKTGSGKSLLLKSALGEVKHVSGSIELPLDKVSYCSQTPWLENMSAEQTWTQYGGGDPKSLAEVLEACFLDDLISLPDYRTGRVGSGGVRLSGGQRQRLALARAIALRKEIVLLDDVFSALDRATRQQISTRLLGPEGLLRRLGTTVLFTTHDSSIAMLADQVYEITVDRSLAPLSLQKPANGDAIENRIAQGETTEKGFDEKDTTASDQAINATVQKVKDDQNEKDTKVSDRQVYLRYVHAMGFKNAGIFLFLVIAFAICLKLPDLWVQWWSTALQQGDTRGNNYWIGMFALLEVLPLLVLCLCIFHLMFFIVPTSASTLHASLLRTVLLAPFAFISRVDTGSLMNRFNQDLMFVDAFLPLDLFNTCAELFTSTFQLILVAIVSKQALAILPALFAVLYFIQRVYLRSSKQLRLLDLSWKADLHTKFGETVSGLSVIRANGWLNPMREKFLEKLDRSQEPFYLLYMVQRWLQLVLNLVVAGLAITIAGVAIGMRDKVAVGAVGVAFLNTTTLGETLTNFIISWTSLETSLGAIARVSMFEQDTPREREEQSNVDVPDDWPKPGQVTFENVWATYDDKDGGSSWRLSGVTLTVKPGERVAVCGRTGSGKSTLLLALLGMLHMPVGSVRVDGIDISALQMTILRRRFKVVSQDSFFEPTSTFRQDLDPSGKISDDDVREILGECRVWEIVAASGGLDSKRSDAKLSAGEAQLLSIARLLLQNPTESGNIILLDEATSSLDRETEQYIERVMSARLQNATVIAVMHRLEAVSTYDKVAVLDKGVLVDFGDVGDVKARCELFK
ncbi:ABC transporter [Colletotrichum gloeosporioides Cg-14]|uniref:ABC transporter n=1 Tax=Colletotrichum gloeosporioides (strain Cg-14) TaxID=1237896 RepID=T0LK70_COLGC|nr:ABC transporter [Colletotrichum gloeosporioides Cg-14]